MAGISDWTVSLRKCEKLIARSTAITVLSSTAAAIETLGTTLLVVAVALEVTLVAMVARSERARHRAALSLATR